MNILQTQKFVELLFIIFNHLFTFHRFAISNRIHRALFYKKDLLDNALNTTGVQRNILKRLLISEKLKVRNFNEHSGTN